jgi:CheY-like chemotaxis protein
MSPPLLQNISPSVVARVEYEVDDVLAVVTDLFFQSRIASAARAADRRALFVRSLSALERQRGTLALVDLDADLDVLAAIRALRAAGTGSIVAFGPHVDTDLRKAAKAAGADRVLAKSKFVSVLPDLMQTRTAVSEE